MSVIYSNLPWPPIIMTDTPALYKMSLSSLSKQLKFGGPDQCQSCSGHLSGSAFRPLKGKSGPGLSTMVEVFNLKVTYSNA